VARLRHLGEAGGPAPPRGTKAPGEVAVAVGGEPGAEADERRAGAASTAAPAAPPPSTDPSAPASAVAWTARRLDRLVVDDLLRRGRSRAAAALLADLGPGTAPLVDAGVWAAAGPALAGLASRDAGPALAWCKAHAARLAKLKSPLEFRLRLQQCVEKARAGDAAGALAHARTHLAPWAAGAKGGGGHGGSGAPASPFLVDLQRVAGLAAFCGRAAAGGPGGAASPTLPILYAFLLDDGRWEDAAAALRREVCRLAGALVGRSPLEAALQAGLAALKPPPGAPGASSADDPLADPALAALASPLPHAKRLHSRLVCGLSGRLMDADNPPAALPSGAVYSDAALRARARAETASGAADGGGGGGGGGDTLTDPETGERVRVADLRRVYVS
jgi:macrophage erythroblast attacher